MIDHSPFDGPSFTTDRFAGMRIENAFDVQAPPDTAWTLLTDVPRVVPCMPGAELERTVDESTWEVLQRVKLGPISLQFRSEVRQTDVNEMDHRALLSVKAHEVRGRGGADATIQSSLQPIEGGTRVKLVTELSLRGAVAQYGRPVVGSVAEELTRQFAACLAAMLEPEGPPAPARAAKPVGGLRLFFAALWRKLFRRG
jgi:carbon monoxide dehydrogenase subunit G